ncbi:MAG: putative baseplate assembly protein [Cyanobacteria bacterium P01_F01_bin.150]
MLRYTCCDQRRRDAVEASALNGIDYLEVIDSNAPSESDRQRILRIYFIKPLTNESLTADNIRILGGERIRNIQITEVSTSANPRVIQVDVAQWGDFSTYTLKIINEEAPLNWLDPILSSINFSFKVECPSDFDCQQEQVCPPKPSSPPDINYLAKDYASFRQLMLDRLSVLMPQGFEQNPASLDMALVELFAYVGDRLSYQQDAIATEAYLDTARRRTSVRRHARLVDYFMHDGCNARTWVQLQTQGTIKIPKSTPLLTRIIGKSVQISPTSSTYDQAIQQQPVIFETMADTELFSDHNQLKFYTWGAQNCCLPAGSTQATLRGNLPNLKPGDVLIFEEVLGPRTGQSEDADPTHRWAVRLTNVTPSVDPIGGQFQSLPTQSPVEVTEITWVAADALPFPLCISARIDKSHGEEDLDNVSVALGNIVMADHGTTIANESLGTVPANTLFRVPVSVGDRCQPASPDSVPLRFRPTLQRGPLTQTEPYPFFEDQPNHANVPASLALKQAPDAALPHINPLTSEAGEEITVWTPQRDLLNSEPQAFDFVVEMETDGIAHLRFGDDRYGQRPAADHRFTATYRIGNGVQGNIGSDALAHVVTDIGGIINVRNPLPATGGTDPESIESVRQAAPVAFRQQQRAVTLADYADIAERHPQVQKAVATFRWTGSWRTVFVTCDLKGRLLVDDKFINDMETYLNQFRLAGYDLRVDAPRFVSLDIDMQVCVQANYFRSDVKASLQQVFSSRILPNGQRGFFHPDNFTFGQSVYLSQLYAIAQAVDGVASIHISQFHRQGIPATTPLEKGVLELDRLEIARLDNDPDYPDHGVLRFTMEGGK